MKNQSKQEKNPSSQSVSSPLNALHRYVYHYHAFRRTGSVETNIDGIATLTFQIRTMDGYEKFKHVIAKDLEGRSDTEGLTVTSLSLLATVNETADKGIQ